MPNVTLGGFNTVAIAAASGVYRLSFVGGSTRSIDVMNLGGGAIFVRGDATNPIPSAWRYRCGSVAAGFSFFDGIR